MAKVDAFAARVTARHARALACRLGCSSCCHQHLSVLPVEFLRVAEAVGALGEEARQALAARLTAGRDDPRCPLLDDAGACRVYAARPLICRTHGLPLQLAPPTAPREPGRRDVCPLNFAGPSAPGEPGLDDLPAEDVLDLERLNTTLVLVDRLEGGRACLAAAALEHVPVDEVGRVDLFEGLTAVLRSS